MTVGESKRSSICRADVISATGSNITSVPGINSISVEGDWTSLGFSAIDFAEATNDNNSYDVTLDLTFSNTNKNNYDFLHSWCNRYVLVKLKYSDGSIRVIGSKDFPVVLSLSEEGNPAKIHLKYSGQQPELSKFL